MNLLDLAPRGTTVYTVVHHVSSSGMSRDVSLYVVDGGQIRDITGLAIEAAGFRRSPRRGIRVTGAGIDGVRVNDYTVTPTRVRVYRDEYRDDTDYPWRVDGIDTRTGLYTEDVGSYQTHADAIAYGVPTLLGLDWLEWAAKIPGARPRLEDGRVVVDVATCGTCGRSWNDALRSAVTPVPSGRCPFEYEHPTERLEYLRSQIEAESISYSEIAELQSLAPYIDRTDVVLLEWAGVPEGDDA